MTVFTAQELDRLQAEAEAAGRKLRPAPIRNGRMFLLMPEDSRSYAQVAKDAGITEGRAGVYVRDYLEYIDRLDEAPQRGRRNGGGTRSITTGNGMLDVAINTREQFLSEQDRIATAVNDANTLAAEFDADEYKAEVAEELRTQIAEFTRRLTAWEADEEGVATKSAESTEADLKARAEKLSTESSDKLEFLDKQVNLANATLRMIVNMDESAIAKIKEHNADLGAEIEAEFAEDSEPEPANTEA